ncbi:MAG TPA: hypothetical protein IAC31_07925 [Candidatus Faecousia intestinigallinarum]|nr:hypothetical protein [Candidatus Faecousia intestinigallinarum]
MEYGFSIAPNAPAICGFCEPSAGFLLCGLSAAPLQGRTLHYLSESVMYHLDRLTGTDIHYAAIIMPDILQSLASWLDELRQISQQPLFFSGVLCYIAGNQFLTLPFGGAEVYHRITDELHHLGNPRPKYIRDALGCHGACWASTEPAICSGSLYFLSRSMADVTLPVDLSPNAASAILRKKSAAAAAMEIRF